MPEQLQVTAVLPVRAERLYNAWLNSEEHAAFTGSSAEIVPSVGGEFSAWDGYIRGKTLLLEPFQRIVQSWRTSDFPSNAPDSQLEILFEADGEQTHLTLNHTNIPDGQGPEYRQGWLDYYFEPMQAYFTAH
jgi:activator of HSP90 ATPase